jgi:hypothetical protein
VQRRRHRHAARGEDAQFVAVEQVGLDEVDPVPGEPAREGVDALDPRAAGVREQNGVRRGRKRGTARRVEHVQAALEPVFRQPRVQRERDPFGASVVQCGDHLCDPRRPGRQDVEGVEAHDPQARRAAERIECRHRRAAGLERRQGARAFEVDALDGQRLGEPGELPAGGAQGADPGRVAAQCPEGHEWPAGRARRHPERSPRRRHRPRAQEPDGSVRASEPCFQRLGRDDVDARRVPPERPARARDEHGRGRAGIGADEDDDLVWGPTAHGVMPGRQYAPG